MANSPQEVRLNVKLNNLDEIEAKLKALVAEARGAYQDLRTAMKEGRELLADVEQVGRENTTRKLEEAVEEGLSRYRNTLDSAIKTAEQAVYNRFDTTMSIILGEDYQSQREGKAPVDQLVSQYLKTRCTCDGAYPHRIECPVRAIVGP